MERQIRDLLEEFREGSLTRRQFMTRASALGISTASALGLSHDATALSSSIVNPSAGDVAGIKRLPTLFALQPNELNHGTITELAVRFQPILNYDSLDRWFPVLAEAWLSHCAPEDWGDPAAKKRGTAIMRTERDAETFSSEQVAGGCANENGRRIKLESSSDPDAIGNPAYASYENEEDLFLNLAGWEDVGVGTFAEGDRAYLEGVYSAYGNAMSPETITSTPLSDLDPVPDFGTVPQPQGPTVYAEVDWAGIYGVIDEEQGTRDFDSRSREILCDYLAINYYVFYPVMEHYKQPKEGGAVLSREGQWEAISLLFEGEFDFDEETDTGRPKSFRLHSDEQPLVNYDKAFVIFSQGYPSSDEQPRADCRLWAASTEEHEEHGVGKSGDHPIAYVSPGNHKNLFQLLEGDTTTVSVPQPELLAAAAGLAAAAAVAGAACVATGFNPTVCAVAGGLAIAALICLLLAELFDSTETNTELPLPPEDEDPSFSRGNGPSATPVGEGGIEFTLRVVDPIQVEAPQTTYPPSPGDVEYPSWWDFAGRWGIKIAELPSNKWYSGTRRVDRFGRSRGYWNALAAVKCWNTKADVFDPIPDPIVE